MSEMCMLRSIFILILFASSVTAQSVIDSIWPKMPDSLFLQIQIPEKDTIQTYSSRLRFAACTRPEATAFLNGKQTKVYPSGAFVGLTNINFGFTTLRFTVKSAAGDSLWKEITVLRPEPMKNSSHDTLVIEDAFLVGEHGVISPGLNQISVCLNNLQRKQGSLVSMSDVIR
jgi:hypothetical protein